MTQIMKTHRSLYFTLLAAAVLTFPRAQAAAQSDEDAIKVVRSVIKADRQAVVTETLQLTAAESEKFWPLYHRYRAEMDKVADTLVQLVREYAAAYPNVPDDHASKMLKNLTDLEKK